MEDQPDLKRQRQNNEEATSENRTGGGDSVDGPTFHSFQVQNAYKMTNQPRGKFIIINNEIFDNFPRRMGTDVDEKNLFDKFSALGFDVVTYNNMKCVDMLKIMVETARNDHSMYDCFGCAILSHGDDGIVYGTDGEIAIERLVEPFRGGTLAGKPKIFIIQACRGKQADDGVELFEHDGPDPAQKVHRIPKEADFLFAYSTVPGYFSFKKEKGSWFIRSLTELLGQYGKSKDFLWILTRVNHKVAYEFQSKNSQAISLSGKKQIPSIVSMLTKDLYFFPAVQK